MLIHFGYIISADARRAEQHERSARQRAELSAVAVPRGGRGGGGAADVEADLAPTSSGVTVKLNTSLLALDVSMDAVSSGGTPTRRSRPLPPRRCCGLCPGMEPAEYRWEGEGQGTLRGGCIYRSLSRSLSRSLFSPRGPDDGLFYIYIYCSWQAGASGFC
jgi:hypothetical protein